MHKEKFLKDLYGEEVESVDNFEECFHYMINNSSRLTELEKKVLVSIYVMEKNLYLTGLELKYSSSYCNQVLIRALDKVREDFSVLFEKGIDEYLSYKEKFDKDVNNIPLSYLNISPRICSSLRRAGYKYVGELDGVSKLTLFKVRNFGEKSLEELSKALEKYGIELKGTIKHKSNYTRNAFKLIVEPNGEKHGSGIMTPNFVTICKKPHWDCREGIMITSGMHDATKFDYNYDKLGKILDYVQSRFPDREFCIVSVDKRLFSSHPQEVWSNKYVNCGFDETGMVGDDKLF